MLPETRALDSVLEQKQAKKKFKVKPAFEPQEVEFTGYSAGTIVIDTNAKFLYLVEGCSTARRYAIAVGREGLLFTGKATVGDKQEWPRWIPTLDMQKREPKHYGQYKDGMDGGADNPLGARAIYLFQGKHDTHIRIHGTNQPQSIGRCLERLLPHDQRPRDRPLQPRQGRHPGRRALTRSKQLPKRPALPAFLFWLQADAGSQSLCMNDSITDGFFRWRNHRAGVMARFPWRDMYSLPAAWFPPLEKA